MGYKPSYCPGVNANGSQGVREEAHDRRGMAVVHGDRSEKVKLCSL